MSTPTLYYLAGLRATSSTPRSRSRRRDAKVRFVDIYTPKGHDACAAPAAGGSRGQPASPAVMFHPNAAGMKAQAKMIVAALKRRVTRTSRRATGHSSSLASSTCSRNLRISDALNRR